MFFPSIRSLLIVFWLFSLFGFRVFPYYFSHIKYTVFLLVKIIHVLFPLSFPMIMIMIDIHFSIFRYKSPKSLLSMLNTSVLYRLRTLHGEGLCFQRKHSNSTLNLPSIPYCGFSCCMPSKMPCSSRVSRV